MYYSDSHRGVVGGVIVAVILILAIIFGFVCTVRVPAGYVAVQYSMSGGVKDEVLSQGWHFVAPNIKTTKYTIGLEQSYLTAGKNGDSEEDESFTASSSEGKAMTIDLTFTYQYKSENVVKVFNQFKGQDGKAVRDSFVKPNIVSWSKEVIARYKVADILGSKRAEVNTALTDYLSEKFEAYGITISNVSLINIEVDEATQQAINEKIQAQQNAETAAIENQQSIDAATAAATVATTEAQAEADVKAIEAQAEADATKTKAEAEAEATKIQAEADAEATKTRGDAEAEANKSVKSTLTDDVLREKWIEQWDGKLPTYSMGGDANYMIDMDVDE